MSRRLGPSSLILYPVVGVSLSPKTTISTGFRGQWQGTPDPLLQENTASWNTRVRNQWSPVALSAPFSQKLRGCDQCIM